MLLKPNFVDIIVYHAHCIDGLTAAAMAYSYSLKNNITYKYIPMRAGELPDEILELEGEGILFLDVSPKYAEYKQFSGRNDVLIIDHHKTAEEELRKVSEEEKIFDMNCSGAVLAWKYFGCDLDYLNFVALVQDKDLNKTVLGNRSKYLFYGLCENLNIITDSNAKINVLYSIIPQVDEIITQGVNALKRNKEYIKKTVESGEEKVLNDIPVWYMKAKDFTLCGDVGMHALETHPDVGFSVLEYPGKNKNNQEIFIYSLRALAPFDVSAIAKKYCGGGHAQAAGFESLTCLF